MKLVMHSNNLFNKTAITVLAATMAGLSAANLTGSGTITYHDYDNMVLASVQNNPPSCGMPYAELDLTRITAVQQMNTATDCGKCIKVTSQADSSKFVYVLAVDTGGRGLDISKTSFGKLFNVDDGTGPASWEPADDTFCNGIWSKSGSGTYIQSTAPASTILVSSTSVIVSSAAATAAPASTTLFSSTSVIVSSAAATSPTEQTISIYKNKPYVINKPCKRAK